jgi:hypothetical protein
MHDGMETNINSRQTEDWMHGWLKAIDNSAHLITN